MRPVEKGISWQKRQEKWVQLTKGLSALF